MIQASRCDEQSPHDGGYGMRGMNQSELQLDHGIPMAPVLTGAFLISPIGWLPGAQGDAFVSASFVSLQKEPGECMASPDTDGVLLFSAN